MEEACATAYPGSSPAFIRQLLTNAVQDLPPSYDSKSGLTVVLKCSSERCRGAPVPSTVSGFAQRCVLPASTPKELNLAPDTQHFISKTGSSRSRGVDMDMDDVWMSGRNQGYQGRGRHEINENYNNNNNYMFNNNNNNMQPGRGHVRPVRPPPADVVNPGPWPTSINHFYDMCFARATRLTVCVTPTPPATTHAVCDIARSCGDCVNIACAWFAGAADASAGRGSSGGGGGGGGGVCRPSRQCISQANCKLTSRQCAEGIISSVTSGPGSCGLHQEFRQCAPCPSSLETCKHSVTAVTGVQGAQAGIATAPHEVCPCRPGCTCLAGFVRLDKARHAPCVQKRQCP
jgi:hypothetical protein